MEDNIDYSIRYHCKYLISVSYDDSLIYRGIKCFITPCKSFANKWWDERIKIICSSLIFWWAFILLFTNKFDIFWYNMDIINLQYCNIISVKFLRYQYLKYLYRWLSLIGITNDESRESIKIDPFSIWSL